MKIIKTNNHTKETFLILKQILSTNSLKKCMEISLENLHVDIGASRVIMISRLRRQI